MPPAKSRLVHEDSRSDASTVRDRQIAAAAHARNSKLAAAKQRNATSLKEPILSNPQAGELATAGQGAGIQWNTMPQEFLDSYRVAHSLPIPAAFTSPYNRALLTNPGIGRQSPTMARKKDQRRIAKEQLALAVRKHFNGAAVNEIDVVVDLAYKVRNKDKAFRMRATPGAGKKP